MTSLRPNLVKRIQRLPKPHNVAGAMTPLFEAVSNAIHSTQAKFGKEVSRQGKVEVVVSTNRKKDDVWATVEDNGLGLDEANWEAFTTTDTDNKIAIGGKGVGRLMWLDCFKDIQVTSVFSDHHSRLYKRSFSFCLTLEEQIQGLQVSPAPLESDTSFFVRFTGVRDNGYLAKFPGRGDYVFQHLTSHFLPAFIGGRCPSIRVSVGDETRIYPDAISEIVYKRVDVTPDESAEFDQLTITLMECDKVASADLKGKHFVHFIAHDRTVHSQKIDGKLGLDYFGANLDRVFHAIVTGPFLDRNVNQERTAFVFEDAVIERIIKDVCTPYIDAFLSEPLSALSSAQRAKISSITQTYPSVAFGSPEELQDRVPSGELKEDAIYGHLARERFRRDERQAEKIRGVLARLKGNEISAETFSQSLEEASRALEETEQRSLAEYIVRRKVVLDFIDLLLENVRDDTSDSAFQREDVLHSFICPLRISTAGSGTGKVEPAASHDLWVVDERLTFAQYFSSDVPFSDLTEAFSSKERPDVLIFDRVHGLRQKQDPSKVLLVEFKRPGRTNYPDSENPQMQVQRYIQQLQSGKLSDVRGRPIELSEQTIFYCYIIADNVGKMQDWTFHWQRTADGRGRILRPDHGFRGSIELVPWDALIDDARARNQAFFDKAGISGESIFTSKG
ncbi:ATP-binding protein [Phaeobacter inhibens]|uniref:ATP-binding protein n=1 Tax=Phaeobacter inhibens TaxID=221822 RepID=UPI0021A3C2BB|nr:ATP-binding protein [Phaeobacter inhibens]UWR91072.1 ATP-binding protein [Phaeobacter inhibens]